MESCNRHSITSHKIKIQEHAVKSRSYLKIRPPLLKNKESNKIITDKDKLKN